MKIVGASWLIALAFATSARANGASDSFEYDPGVRFDPSVLNGQDGGVGFAGPWLAQDRYEIGAGLVYGDATHVLQSSGNGISVLGFGQFDTADRPLARSYGQFTETVWLSFIFLRVVGSPDNDFAGIILGPPEGDWLGGDLLYFGSRWDEHFVIQAQPGTDVDTGIVSEDQEAYFVVARVTFEDGPDTIALFINPPLAFEPVVPDAVRDDLEISFDMLRMTSGGSLFSMDEARIGPTYRDVAPLVNKCVWDLSADGQVGPADLAIMLSLWGEPFGPGQLAELLGAWGACGQSSSKVK